MARMCRKEAKMKHDMYTELRLSLHTSYMHVLECWYCKGFVRSLFLSTLKIWDFYKASKAQCSEFLRGHMLDTEEVISHA